MSLNRPTRALWEKIGRNAKVARTYIRNAEDFLYGTDFDMHTNYWPLLDDSLDLATAIIERLPDHFFEEEVVGDFFGIGGGRVNISDLPAERIEKLTAAFQERRERGKKQRRIALLENVEGRTPEEAAAFLAKAAELRGGR